MAERSSAAPAQPSPPELLRAALEKVVFFEWRLSEIAAELSAAEARCSSAELERARADETARAAQAQAQAARLRIAELEADRSRLAALLARPAHVFAAPPQTNGDRAAQLESELLEARRELSMQKAERARWLNEMIEQARNGDEAPAALAQFISELRGDIIALREQQKQSDALLRGAGLSPPPAVDPLPVTPVAAPREPEPVEAARRMWAEGRLGAPGLPASLPDGSHAPEPVMRGEPASGGLGRPLQGESGPARALAEQCLRALGSLDPGRREQAARHLAALPLPAAAPLLASALGGENEPRARANLARALAACGGEGAAHVVERLQQAEEPALVRLAALEALCQLGGDRALAALQRAALDAAPAVRRRAAALAASTDGAGEIFSRLGTDEDASVRRMKESARNEAPSSAADSTPRAPPPSSEPALAERDVAQEALLAVQAAMFGLTDGELAQTLNVAEPEAFEIAARLVSAGRLGRRGKRLVAAQGA